MSLSWLNTRAKNARKPKSEALVKEIAEHAPVIFEFFAGAGSLGDAILKVLGEVIMTCPALYAPSSFGTAPDDVKRVWEKAPDNLLISVADPTCVEGIVQHMCEDPLFPKETALRLMKTYVLHLAEDITATTILEDLDTKWACLFVLQKELRALGCEFPVPVTESMISNIFKVASKDPRKCSGAILPGALGRVTSTWFTEWDRSSPDQEDLRRSVLERLLVENETVSHLLFMTAEYHQNKIPVCLVKNRAALLQFVKHGYCSGFTTEDVLDLLTNGGFDGNWITHPSFKPFVKMLLQLVDPASRNASNANWDPVRARMDPCNRAEFDLMCV
jgi:hypothetical protein